MPPQPNDELRVLVNLGFVDQYHRTNACRELLTTKCIGEEESHDEYTRSLS